MPRQQITTAQRIDAALSDPVRAYLNEVGRTPLLTAEQEVELSRRIEAGLYAAHLLEHAVEDGADEPVGPSGARRVELAALAADGERAKAHMVRANLRLVVSVAKKYSHRGLPFLDLIQEGNLGLIRAVEKFDYRKGYKFSTYAIWWVRQAIGRGIAEQSRTIRLPVHVNDDVAKLQRAERDLVHELGRPATLAEVAGRLGTEITEVERLRRVARDPVSLDAPIGDDGEGMLAEILVEDDAPTAIAAVEHAAMLTALGEVLDTLPPRSATIVRMRYGLDDGHPHTLEQIARHVGLTRERVRQLEREALQTLRKPGHSEPLLEWAS